MNRRKLLLLGPAFALAPLALAHAAPPPPLMLAEVYRRGMPLADYWVSEKYDGVRGYWDGKQLWTRGGTPVAAPAWFIATLPAVPMDGELWAGRGRFAQTVSTVRDQVPDDAAWREIQQRAATIGAEAEMLAEGSELRLVADLPSSEASPA